MEVTTFQNVQINIEKAGVGHRVFATIIDLLLQGAYSFAISLTIAQINEVLAGFFLLPLLFYTLSFEYFLNGQTPGKKAMKIRVTAEDGNKPTISQFLLRWLFRLVDILLTFGSLAIVLVSFTKKRGRLGDILAGTIVVKVKEETSLKQLKKKDFEIVEGYTPQFPEVLHLTDKDYNVILSCFRSAQKTNNFQLMIELKSKVEKMLHISSELKPYEFIPHILKDYHYYFNQDRK